LKGFIKIQYNPRTGSWKVADAPGVTPIGVGNAVKDLEAGFSRHVAVRSANVRIFAERKATYLPTEWRQNA
jgi:hypothetical protein